MCEEAKRVFLTKEFFNLTYSGSVQHSSTYSNANERQRRNIKNRIYVFISQMNIPGDIEAYNKLVDELSHTISQQFGNYLENNRLRIGTSQKLIGLHLKYRWVVGLIDEPPACPFDGRILRHLHINDCWTQNDDIKSLNNWIGIAGNVAQQNGYNSIAQWELFTWNN